MLTSASGLKVDQLLDDIPVEQRGEPPSPVQPEEPDRLRARITQLHGACIPATTDTIGRVYADPSI